MSDFSIFRIAGSALQAQSVRLNTVASNLANADTVAGTPDAVYKARLPVFETELDNAAEQAGVRVSEIVQSAEAPQRIHRPGHPDADENGYVYATNVNPVEEMVNMISASRSYQTSAEVLNTGKDLILKTLELGR
ncbi:flagellar basal body rod protein FlgC [uncultured Abyssibacter sp.]|uniref:flagellar basal body rod protein FlgC n=1 Tax=uncultured Abyssibacter sp. TaxID=2320202 RepID=UPI0032B1A935